ncbi:hypothetical protein GCM10007424_20500 [Flavobacterium suaedae]|uniref:Immunity protein 35 domain-containing protein n=1 Tax=Flavobacterium suaedae TaxID=1767027 RepID=A0ABQ1JWU5_9FLAO|nr:YrhB domain-containing protein [Flavobacterium suaedae]GGB80289.1 hypothetical protein GCM10007424_20500 [Flavobacterium suaedae]
MLTEQEILNIANSEIKRIENDSKIETVLINELIIKKPYGNIFFYTSKKYYETRNEKYAVAGNAPFLVEKETGNIVVFGTAHTEDYYIEEYEAGRWPNNRGLD